MFQTLIGLALAWIVFFVIHSVLASEAAKRWVQFAWPDAFKGYRLFYNLIALATLIPILLYVSASTSAPIWNWPEAWEQVGNGISILAGLGFVWTLRDYDGQEFLGLRQLQQADATACPQRLSLSPLHAIVRHPWYFLLMLVIWPHPMNPEQLTSAMLVTGYLIVGSRLEERKLVGQFGQAYRVYQTLVPALFPLPWKWLTTAQRHSILAQSEQPSSNTHD